jgi:cytochrome c-type biogenesis protein
MMPFIHIPWPHAGWTRHMANAVRPGHLLSSLFFGAIFALGWTPCIGPVLGAVLTLAATSVTLSEGAWLLAVFSLGLGLPFLVAAGGIGWFSGHIASIAGAAQTLSFCGGAFLIFLGILIATNSLGVWISFFFNITGFIGYERLLNYL